MTWTGRSEAEACCPCGFGPVGDEETVARLIVRDVPCQGYNPYDRTQFFPPADRAFSNACGEQDGFSIDRCLPLDPDRLRRRSVALAGEMTGRRRAAGSDKVFHGDGAALTATIALRQVRRDKRPAEQVLVLYDDPVPGNDHHAVVRGSLDIPPVERRNVIQKAARLFDPCVGMPADVT